MAYLDDRSRINGLIFLLTVPALAFLTVRAFQSLGSTDSSATLDELGLYINPVVWVSPIFVIIQVSKMVAGTAARSWQNILCTVVTATAAVILWRG